MTNLFSFLSNFLHEFSFIGELGARHGLAMTYGFDTKGNCEECTKKTLDDMAAHRIAIPF